MKDIINLNEPDYFNGPLCAPMDESILKKYYIRGLIKYCEEKNVSFEELTPEELKQFEK